MSRKPYLLVAPSPLFILLPIFSETRAQSLLSDFIIEASLLLAMVVIRFFGRKEKGVFRV